MTEGDFVVVTRGEPHLIYSDRRTKPFPLMELDRPRGRLGVVRHGGSAPPISTMNPAAISPSCNPLAAAFWNSPSRCFC